MVVPSQRYFYHSFPRRGRATDQEAAKGCEILELIADAGLLLAPEVVEWRYPHADGSAPREQSYIQRRACFTELSPPELPGHAEEFGHFALEFDTETIKRMGAMPVFYVPQAVGAEADGRSSLGSTLVIQAMDAMVLMMRLAGVAEALAKARDGDAFNCTFGFQNLRRWDFEVTELRRFVEAFTYAITPPEMLQHGLEGLLACFYPADNLRHSAALAHYRQREWRIAWNFAHLGEELMRRPSQELVDRLLKLDAEFFGRPFPTPKGQSRLGEEAYVYPRLGDTKIIHLARRVIAPRDAMAQAARILSRFAPDVPLVCINELAD
jgi:hypothetical protein